MKNIYDYFGSMKEINIGTIAALVSLTVFLNSCADPCETQVCFNGGVCVNGECVCPFPFGGADCQTEYNDIGKVTFWADQAMCDYYNDWFPGSDFGINWELRIDGEIVKTFKPCNHVRSSEPDCGEGFFDYEFQWTAGMQNVHNVFYTVTASSLNNGVSTGDGALSTGGGYGSTITIYLEEECAIARAW